MRNAKIGEIATALGVSLQTVRNWLKLGEGYYSETATRKHGKRFTPSDLEQLQRIQRLLSEGHRLEQIPEMLPAAPQVVEVFDDIPPGPPEQPQETTNAVEVFGKFQDQSEQFINTLIQIHERELADKDKQIEYLRGELDRARLPWWNWWKRR